jgi:hypothetical protein
MDHLRQRVLFALNCGSAEELAAVLYEISSHNPNNKAAELNVNSKLGHPANDKINTH